MPTPSLLIVPARFKTGKLYSQIPTSGAGDFTVTRNTAARRFDSAGLVASVASGIPRLDYFTSGGVTGCPALLVEPAGTNLAFHSENWGSNWLLDGATRTTGSTSAFLAPDGTFTANALSPTSGNVAHYIYSNTTTKILFVSGTIYTQSVFCKAGGTNLPVSGSAGRYAQLTFNGGSFSQLGYANFDLQLGTVAVVSGTSADANRTARIENYGNGWYRCILTATCTAAANNEGVYSLLVNASGNTRAQSFAGVTGDILYGWGAQLETGSVATSYIPTTAATGSRSADIISVTGAVSGSIGQQSGTIYAEVDFSKGVANGLTKGFIFALSDNTNNNAVRINWFRSVGGVYRYELRIRANNVAVYSVDIDALTQAFGTLKIAFAYKENDVAIYENGALLTSSSSVSLSGLSLSKINLGQNFQNALQFNDRIRAVALYTTRLTNAELATLTTP